jgi:hypothetical protein
VGSSDCHRAAFRLNDAEVMAHDSINNRSMNHDTGLEKQAAAFARLFKSVIERLLP